MKKKQLLFFLSLVCLTSASAQQMVLKKGEIMDSIPVQDSIPSSFSLYLPRDFSTDKKWPLLLVFDLEGKERQTMSIFVGPAEKEGYILAAPKVKDTVSLTNNMIVTNNVLEEIVNLLPIQRERIYTAGASGGGRFAGLVPIFIRGVSGTISIGASLTNTDLLNVRQPFHFIGMVSKEDYNYPTMLEDEKLLDRYKFPNQIVLHEEKNTWPQIEDLQKGLQLFTLAAMGRKLVPMDSMYVDTAYKEDIAKVNLLKNSGRLIWAEQYLGEMMSMYGAHKNLDSLREVQKELRRDKQFRAMRRSENAAFSKEILLKENYQYDMEEDMFAHNFKNLGWWNYQMDEIDKFINGSNIHEQEMGHRLVGFLNALAEDNIALVQSGQVIDEDALAFMYMLKTILEPENFEFYLKTISLSAKNEDFGTALFYLEEAFQKGFKDRDKLYSLEDTALLRITPEFNKMVEKYLKDARYDIIEQ
ncbi:alpha/beta hydrolase [Muricauda sp. CAU 1633]|uniref:alpha/beta hydrolase n=1 Tax=Allomuricauda sp. CAU 1633 TaxID=2816036 RepID=UPI001A905AB5|nr:alpha/beta hydrolase [Muricauda sp. CAU 1633]MBO0321944.1 alpha/beta hydrolase [Muricauda sp. CAU 1633]